MNPGPPPGPPILDDHENQTLDSFFTGFTDGQTTFPAGIHQNNNWIMPPTFVRSETSLGPRAGNDWQGIPTSDFSFINGQSLSQIASDPNFGSSIPANNYMTQSRYDNNTLNQLHLAAQAVQPAYPQGWQQQFASHHTNEVRQVPRQHMVQFGTDASFRTNGYVPPEGHFQPDPIANLDWLEAQSSAGNTRPNTRPNTQPSSPTVSRKRKLEDHHEGPRRNGYISSTNGYSAGVSHSSNYSNSYPHKKPQVKQEPNLASKPDALVPVKSVKTSQETEDDVDDDADYDEDEDDHESQQRSPSPAFGARSKSSKHNKQSISHKGGRLRKKSTSSNTPVKLKSKPARSSVGGTPSTRVPLSADQKKLNHTNSEQRRRDATAKAYAELYDLVPELDELGKQSTMKKLEIVVAKVARVKSQVAQLRSMLGMDPDGGASGMRPAYTNTHPSSSINPYATDSIGWRS